MFNGLEQSNKSMENVSSFFIIYSYSHIDVLEDVLTLSSRITSLQLYSTSQQNMRINSTPVYTIHSIITSKSI